MDYIFKEATNADPDTSGWDVGNVTIMQYMFTNSGISNENYSKFLIDETRKLRKALLSCSGAISAV